MASKKQVCVILYFLHFPNGTVYIDETGGLEPYAFSSVYLEQVLFGYLSHLDNEKAQKMREILLGGEVLFSDAMPYNGDIFYFPKPFGLDEKLFFSDTLRRKTLKKMSYVPADLMAKYTLSRVDGFMEEAQKLEDIGTFNHLSKRFCFAKNCGLYIMVKYESDSEEIILKHRKAVETMLDSMGSNLVGNSIGKFTISDVMKLKDLDLWSSEEDRGDVYIGNRRNYYKNTLDKYGYIRHCGGLYTLLNTAVPDDKRDRFWISGNGETFGSYRVTKTILRAYDKKNNIESEIKKELFMFSAGSNFEWKFKGTVKKETLEDGHEMMVDTRPFFLPAYFCVLKLDQDKVNKMVKDRQKQRLKSVLS